MPAASTLASSQQAEQPSFSTNANILPCQLTLERRAVIFDHFLILFLILQRRQLKFDSGHHVSFYSF